MDFQNGIRCFGIKIDPSKMPKFKAKLVANSVVQSEGTNSYAKGVLDGLTETPYQQLMGIFNQKNMESQERHLAGNIVNDSYLMSFVLI